MSISPTFYEQLSFYENVFAAFLYLQFGIVIFCQKNIGTKTAHKMLVKLNIGLIPLKISSCQKRKLIIKNCKKNHKTEDAASDI
jgi:hypothetical protein